MRGYPVSFADVMESGGSGGSQCADYIKDYFSIVEFHNGHFDLTGTLNARVNYTNQCLSATTDAKRAVNNNFGNKKFM
ncbi:hypothetical protein [Caballeronia sp. GAWG1-1]|uniref:hypothetical protein n=1 Tax=Caballeronia sp. GAWG1-1 TaxID=2921742 RepID=UPI0020283C36|nr:hypothetical protein [Caballeronia sp. GAWG1-1]